VEGYPVTERPVVQGHLNDTLTLGEALSAAESANARLPVAALGVDIARTAVKEGRASRLPRVSLQSSINAGAPLAYTTLQGALQMVAFDTLFAGGLRRANIRAARYRVAEASAGFRMAVKDVDLSVRLRYSEFLKAEDEIAFRLQGIEHLKAYLIQIQQRRAAGRPVRSDVLTTQVRLGSEEALLADARRMLDEARLQLNNLIGRLPDAPLVVAPLSGPAPPPAMSGTRWATSPDVSRAEASTLAINAGIAATRSERRPQVAVSASAGALPVFGHDQGTGPNSGSGLGGLVFFSVSLPLLDGGVYNARLQRAQIQAQQAADSEIVVKQQVRLAYQLAAAQLTTLYQQVATWSRNISIARDAYLQTESIYTGGSATALEVLDAYTSWISAQQSYADALLRYRTAEANYLRWGTP
jgi:outer membrane protein